MVRRDIKFKNVVNAIGTIAFLIGLAGLGGACEGEGSFLIASIVFGIGFGLSLWGYTR